MSELAEIQALDGAKLRYALMDLSKSIPDAIALGRGDPDMDTPPFIVEAGIVEPGDNGFLVVIRQSAAE